MLAKDASLRRVDKVDGVDPTSAKLYFKLITVITYFKLITAIHHLASHCINSLSSLYKFKLHPLHVFGRGLTALLNHSLESGTILHEWKFTNANHVLQGVCIVSSIKPIYICIWSHA